MKCRSDQTLQHFLVDISTLSMDMHFPLRLYAMLEYASGSEHGSAIHWTHNGQAFVVSQLDVVVEHVLPVFFNLTKFRSFVSYTSYFSPVFLALWNLTMLVILTPLNLTCPNINIFNRLASSTSGVYSALPSLGKTKTYGSIRTSFVAVPMASSTSKGLESFRVIHSREARPSDDEHLTLASWSAVQRWASPRREKCRPVLLITWPLL